MKIYGNYRNRKSDDRKEWVQTVRSTLKLFRRHRQGFRPRVPKKIVLVGLSIVVMAGGLALLQWVRQSFAYQPPLDDTLLIRPTVLASFQSVPLSDPDEFEPDSMDRIEDVVEEIKPAVTALTRREMRYAKHRIKAGESLWDIARRNGIRTATLLYTNSAVVSDPAKLPVGKEIRVPNMDAIEVRLRPGESLTSVAKRYAVNPSEVVKFNRITDAKLVKSGEKIIVPNPNLVIQHVSRAKAVRGTPSSDFIWPSSYRLVNSEFGFRMHPIRKRRIFHEGIDIGGGRGSTVFSAGDGSVGFVGWMRGYGKIVVIRHKDGITTRYAHLSSTKVARGQRVEQGQTIGTVGATGLATGPNLHFEVRKFGLPQDPLKYIKR